MGWAWVCLGDLHQGHPPLLYCIWSFSSHICLSIFIQNMYQHCWKTIAPCLAHKKDMRGLLPCCAAAEVQNTWSKSNHLRVMATSEGRREISYSRVFHANKERMPWVSHCLDQKTKAQHQQSKLKNTQVQNSPMDQRLERVTKQQNVSCRSQKCTRMSEGCHIWSHRLWSWLVENSRELDVVQQCHWLWYPPKQLSDMATSEQPWAGSLYNAARGNKAL